MMEYEKCYVFHPDDEPPSKRRRTEASGLHRTWPSRRKQLKKAWNRLDEAFSDAISTVNESNVNNIHNFLATTREHNEQRIATGIILLEPGSSSKSRVLNTHVLEGCAATQIIGLESSAAPNLKTALKSINDAALRNAGTALNLESINEADEDEAPAKATQVKRQGGRRFLAYDLEILKEYVNQSKISSIVIHLEDTEGFSGEVLSDLIEHLSFWCDRMPITLLMNVSTSIEMLERRLSRTARSKLKCELFPAATCEEEFESLIRVLMRDDSDLVLGPSIIRLAAQRQSDYLQDIALIKDGLKYVTMSAYFANPLTSFLDAASVVEQSAQHDLVEALRIVPSFRDEIRRLLDDDNHQQARSLFTDYKALRALASERVKEGRASIQRLFVVLEVIWQIQSHITATRASPLATVYIQGLSGTLRGSASLRGLFLAMRKAPLASIENVLVGLPDGVWQARFQPELDNVRRLLHDNVDGAGNKATQHKTITELVGRICKTLEAEVDQHLIDPKTLLFHEVFFWDSTTPYRESLAAKPRQAVERALSTPHDYLDCECCDVDEEADLSATQPPTTVLYGLYKESGNLINIHDAWQAFESVFGEDKGEQQTMALFQRSLAELKHLGMVKNTRKRIDHVAKVAWPGL